MTPAKTAAPTKALLAVSLKFNIKGKQTLFTLND